MRIGIVGAGISGLRTAQLLEKQGAEVFVFEARDRLGGRLKTESVDGGFFESGGEWIDADHSRVISLLAEFGQEPVMSEQWPGRVIKMGDIVPENRVWQEAQQDLDAVQSAAEALCKKLPDNLADLGRYDQLDQQTLASWLDSQCSHPVGRWLVEAVQRSDEGEDTKRVGLLGWLIGYKHYLDRNEGDMSLYRLPDGGEELCNKIAATLSRPVELNRKLTSLEVHDNQVGLWFGGELAIFDCCVMTLPPKVLLAIEFPLEFPESKREAWKTVGSARAIKVSLQFKRPIWQDVPGWSGRMITDLPFQQAWDGGRNGISVMSTYICGDEAEWVLARPNPVETVLASIDEVIPTARQEFVRGWVFDWIHDPFALGAFTSLAPNSVFHAMPSFAEAWEGIHFAGEYASSWTGFVEGALESAERVAEEMKILVAQT